MSMTGDYPNRSDLRNPATRQVRFTGQTYGQATQQAQAQQAVPAGSSPEMVQAQQMAAQQQGAPRPQPGAQPLARPSERPNEPITAGAPFGPGPSPSQAGIRPRMIPENPVVEQLKVLYQMYPNDELMMLLERYSDTPI